MELIVNPASIYMAYEASSRPKYYIEIIGGDHIRFGDFDATDADFPNIVQSVAGGDLEDDAARIVDATGAAPGACEREVANNDELISGDRQRELLRTVALPFFDAYLRDDESAHRFLEDELPSLEGIRLEADLP
jgi:hypothetical protein